jgi:cardiolipin synthase
MSTIHSHTTAGFGWRPTTPVSADALQVAGHELTVFVEAEPLAVRLLADLRWAQKRIWIESYIFAADEMGRTLAQVLKAKARQGLDVRVMYDAVGCLTTPDEFFEDLAAAGVRVHGFHQASEALRRWAFLRVFNRRNHRKLVVIDDSVAYFGGMNLVDPLGDAALEEARSERLPEARGWRDVHVRLVGPQQAAIAAMMDYLWRKVDHERVRQPRWALRQMLSCRQDGLFVFDCQPGFRGRRAARVLCPLLRRARHTITISMAYFLPTGSVLRELLQAARRGVRIRVLIPGNSDVPLAHWACRHNYHRLLKAGIRIFERRERMLHSKVLVIDDQWSIVGSCNLDPRSLRSNLEFLCVVRSREFAGLLTNIAAIEMRHSHKVVEHHWRSRSRWRRLLDAWAWKMRKWL